MSIVEVKKDAIYQINNFVTLDLTSGDEVILFNGIEDSDSDSAIIASEVHPFTFAGYKM